VTKLCVLEDLELRAPADTRPTSSPTPADVPAKLAGRATTNDQRNLLEPAAPLAVPAADERSVAVTVTRSPRLNGRAG
jgi:hypothetical protein